MTPHIPHGTFEWIAFLSAGSTIASAVCNVLPNAKYLDGYPRAQKAYGTVIALIAATALNVRACLPSLDVPAPLLGITKPQKERPPSDG